MKPTATRLLAILAASGWIPVAPTVAAGQGVFQDPDALFSFSDVAFPSVVDTFAVLQVTRWPDPDLGVTLRYGSPLDPGAQLNLYVYPGPDPADADADTDPLRREFEKAVAGVRQYVERSDHLDAVVEAEDTVTIETPAGDRYRGWRAELTLQNGESASRSLLFLFEKHGSFFKYRLTHRPAMRVRLDRRLDRFMALTLDRVTPKAAAGDPTAPAAFRHGGRADPVRGHTIRWTWTEGPVAGVTHEHVFGTDGTVTWRVLGGPQQGHSGREDDYAVYPVSDSVYAVSYLAASGYTLTVVLNFVTREMFGFASGADAWHPGQGTFDVVR